MTTASRTFAYLRQNNSAKVLTPRQRRRVEHKRRHAQVREVGRG
jgi:hypothetical protein